MNKLIRIAITPLSPLHIGCGEDYEPTRYVVDQDKRLLYSFKPESVRLSSALRRELLSATASGKLEDIYHFYERHVKDYRPWADTVIPMDRGSIRLFRNRNQTFFSIPRTVYAVCFSSCKPYLPGSTLKGLIKTAKVDFLNHGKPIENKNINSILLGGDFDLSPLRFLKVSDCYTSLNNSLVSICRAGRIYKKTFKPCKIPASFECVNPFQYRAFRGEITLVDSTKNPNIKNVYHSFNSVIRDLNAYAETIWKRESHSFYRKLQPQWTVSVETLLSDIKDSIAQEKVALIRIGKNTGAESKTLSGEIAQIKSSHSNKIYETTYQSHTTTMWVVLDDKSEIRENPIPSGMPFGWALLEVLEGDEENSVLQTWCKKNRERTISVEKVLEEERQTILREREALQNEIEKALNQEKAENEKRQKEEDERLAREEALSKLTPEERSIENIIAKLSATTGLINPGSDLFREVKTLLETALTWERPQDKKFLAEKISPFMKKRGLYQGKNERSIKAQLRELRGE